MKNNKIAIKDWNDDTMHIYCSVECDGFDDALFTVLAEESVDLSVEEAQELIAFLQEGIQARREFEQRVELDTPPKGFVPGARVTHKTAPADHGILIQRIVRNRGLSRETAYPVWLVGWEQTSEQAYQKLEEQLFPAVSWHTEESLTLEKEGR